MTLVEYGFYAEKYGGNMIPELELKKMIMKANTYLSSLWCGNQHRDIHFHYYRCNTLKRRIMGVGKSDDSEIVGKDWENRRT